MPKKHSIIIGTYPSEMFRFVSLFGHNIHGQIATVQKLLHRIPKKVSEQWILKETWVVSVDVYIDYRSGGYTLVSK